MGEFSIKGERMPATHLPCAECVSKPCCRRGNHGSAYAASIDGVGVPYNAHGDCPHLVAERCDLQDNKPRGCLLFDCSRDLLFRLRHPDVDALLIRKGM